jgi:hypothetical protein
MSGYRVEELLGAGSSGEVWRARVNASGVAVALKRIWLSDPAQRKAALSEAAMLSTLDHPHLMKLHEVRHVDDDAIVLVLDLAAGGSLASLLARRGRLTVGETITTIAPIGAALAYAHHNGVVHGDVSSANILFTDIGLPLLADLGVARLLGDTHPVRTTPAYADPTVASGALPGPTSDVFMLGAVALHALTGSPAWPGSDPGEVFEAAATGEQPDFAARMDRAAIPETVRAVIARALSVNPAYRGTTADFALDLRHAADPVAVELSAGRPLVAASTAGRVESWPLESVPVGAAHVGSTGPSPVFVGEQPLTYGVRAPSPFTTPAGRHLARSRPRIATGFGVCAVLLALLVLSAVWWWPFGGSNHPRAQSSSVARVDVATTPTASASPTPTGAPDAALDARRVLAALDATRSRAFARRDPALLASVYASRELRARDRAQLLAIVPSGCGLHGVRTRFSQVVVVSRSRNGAQVKVAAAVAPSRLVCDGTTSGRAPGTGIVTLRMTLVRRDGRYLIVAETNRH